MIHLQVKGRQGWPATSRDKESGSLREPTVRYLEFELPASRTLKEQTSVVLSHPVCGHLPWQPPGQVWSSACPDTEGHLQLVPCPLGHKGKGGRLAGLSASTEASTQA